METTLGQVPAESSFLFGGVIFKKTNGIYYKLIICCIGDTDEKVTITAESWVKIL